MGSRKSNIIYRLRQKGIAVNTQERTVYLPPCAARRPLGLRRLCAEFHFAIQLEMFGGERPSAKEK